MHRISLYIVISLTFLLLLLEGLGNVFVHTYFALFSTPLLIASVLLILRNKTSVNIPTTAQIGWLLLLISVVLSTFGFSLLKHESLFLSFLYFHFCTFYVLGNSYRQELTNVLPRLIVVWATVNTLYAVYIVYTKTPLEHAYQFIYPTFGSHNHGGELAALAFLVLIVTPFPKVIRVSLGGVFLLATLLSFSRSAYIWLLVSYGILFALHRFKWTLLHGIASLVAVVSLSILLIATIRPIPLPQLLPLQNVLIDAFNLSPRAFVSGRDSYFSQSVQAIFENPYWGSGVGSFTFTTRKFAEEFHLQTNHAHNLLLEVGVEQGIVGLIGLLCILAAALWSILKHKPSSVIVGPFLFLLLTFQTDYIYAINGILLLFFLFAGMITTSKAPKKNPVIISIIIVFAIIQIVWIDMVIASMVALGFNKPELAIKLYPLSVTAYKKALNTLPFSKAQRYVDGYLYASPNTATYLDVADFYAKNKNTIEAILYYEKAVLSNPSLDLAHIIRYAKLLHNVRAPYQMAVLKKTFINAYNYYDLYEIPPDLHPQIREVCTLLAPSCNSIQWFSQIINTEEQ